MSMNSFAETVKKAREKKGLTQDAVAQAIQSVRGYVNGIESGKTRPPSPKVIARLARKLDLDYEQLLALAHVEKRPPALRLSTLRDCINKIA